MHVCGPHVSEVRRGLELLELDLQTVVSLTSSTMWVLESEPESSVTTTNVLNHGAVAPVPSPHILLFFIFGVLFLCMSPEFLL